MKCYILPKSYVYHTDQDCPTLANSDTTLRTLDAEDVPNHMTGCGHCTG